jgi:hypothetical protein
MYTKPIVREHSLTTATACCSPDALHVFTVCVKPIELW